ncbi:MAG: type II secretion system F family protein [Planctomycetota bacterium]
MATFLYEAIGKDGKKVRDEIDAPDKKTAVAQIRSQGMKPTAIKESAGGGGGVGAKHDVEDKSSGGPARAGKTGRVPLKLLTQFTTQLAILQDAGLPIVRSLKILEGQQNHPGFKRVLGQVAEDVETGSPLSEAMAKHPKCFDRLYTNMIKAGEMGGVLDTILNRLAEFMEKNAALKRKIVGASVYPIVVMTIAVVILVAIMLFVIPTFETMFKDMGVALPVPTQILMAMSRGMMDFWYLIPLIPLALFFLFKAWTSTAAGGYAWDAIKLKVPIIGTIVKKGTIARFTRTLGTLISSGVPILEALAIVKNAVGNQVLTKAIDGVYESIREGDTIAAPLASSNLFDDLVVNMIDVGEETGELDRMLIKIADQYDMEVDIAVESMTSVLEPIMIVFMGGGVGFIVVSLFLPMISIIQNLGK